MSTTGINDDSQTVVLLCNTFTTPGSQMCWFASSTVAESGAVPGIYDLDTLAPGRQANPSGFVTWEGNQINGQFSGHLGFTTQIQGNAGSQPINTLVGQAYHNPPFAVPPPGSPAYGYNVFNIYRDNDRVVYTDPTLGDVQSIYYCTWVSLERPLLMCFGFVARG
jgi:hypothetical protein